ncbi:MAG: class II aldolase [Spirochaetales bacterium]|nr:class II aldolase [Spirochaetales bacterium]
MADLTDLIKISRKYGSDPAYLLAGGGNTSMKEDGVLYVKASGFALSDITEEGFVRMNLSAMGEIWNKNYPEESAAREAEILKDMMASRLEGEVGRPSVEALLHSNINGRIVVHTHPALVNGMTCGKDGEKICKELFGDKALWVDSVNPGFILAKTIRTAVEKHMEGGLPAPEMIFLQNHGLFVGADTVTEIEDIHSGMMKKLAAYIKREPAVDEVPLPAAFLADFSDIASKAYGKKMEVCGVATTEVLIYAESKNSFAPLALPFNPDQIVYSGPGPLRLDKIEDLSSELNTFMDRWGKIPQGVLIKDIGLFSVGDTARKAATALALVLDSIKIAVYSESFGGPNPMTEDQIIFIRDWEVESFRAKVQ